MSQPSYIDVAAQGRHNGWRYLGGFGLILFVWLIIGSIATFVLILFFVLQQGLDIASLDQILSGLVVLGPIPYFLVANISFIFFFGGTWLATWLFHRRPLRTLVTGAPRVNWRRMGTGFVIWLALAALGSLLEFLIWPETFSIQFQPLLFITFAILALCLTPMQAASEELFFRGYLVQAGSLISRNTIFLSLLSGIAFTLPHYFNPEVASNRLLVLPYYFLLGVFLAWISLKDGTIELAIGLHVANNLFACLAVTFPQSALLTPAIIYTMHFDPLFNLVMVAISCALFYLLTFGWRKQQSPMPTEQMEGDQPGA